MPIPLTSFPHPLSDIAYGLLELGVIALVYQFVVVTVLSLVACAVPGNGRKAAGLILRFTAGYGLLAAFLGFAGLQLIAAYPLSRLATSLVVLVYLAAAMAADIYDERISQLGKETKTMERLINLGVAALGFWCAMLAGTLSGQLAFAIPGLDWLFAQMTALFQIPFVLLVAGVAGWFLVLLQTFVRGTFAAAGLAELLAHPDRV
jgi:hypothetical protein